MTDAVKQYDVTDETTRRKIFWLLQRLTSYSFCKRKRVRACGEYLAR